MPAADTSVAPDRIDARKDTKTEILVYTEQNRGVQMEFQPSHDKQSSKNEKIFLS